MKTSIFLFSALISLVSLQAQDRPGEVRFTVEVSTDSLLMGNALQVRFTVENGQPEDFEAPYFSGFEVASGPNYTSSMSIVNGQAAQKVSYTYLLLPREVGNYFIEPASVRVDGQILESNPMEVIVVPNPDGAQQSHQMPELQQAPHFNMPGLNGFGFEGFGFPGFGEMPDPSSLFFNLQEHPAFKDLMERMQPPQPHEAPQAPKKKQRKTYKL